MDDNKKAQINKEFETLENQLKDINSKLSKLNTDLDTYQSNVNTSKKDFDTISSILTNSKNVSDFDYESLSQIKSLLDDLILHGKKYDHNNHVESIEDIVTSYPMVRSLNVSNGPSAETFQRYTRIITLHDDKVNKLKELIKVIVKSAGISIDDLI